MSAERLTPRQKEALAFLREVNVPAGEWCGYVSSETYRDRYGPPIHYRTAKSLEERGLIRCGPWERDSDGAWTRDIFLLPAQEGDRS